MYAESIMMEAMEGVYEGIKIGSNNNNNNNKGLTFVSSSSDDVRNVPAGICHYKPISPKMV